MWPYVIAATVLGGGYYAITRKKPGMIGKSAPPEIGPGGQPVNPVTGKPVPAGTPTFASQVADSGVAVNSAKELHDYLKTNGVKNLDAIGKGLVQNFQKAANSDALAVALHGPLPVTGTYDTRTSAALTLYTKDAIPADPAIPKPLPSFAQSIDFSVPGDASMAAFNLSTYLDKNGNDKSDALKQLVKQFQADFNTDPKYAGPASTLKPLITTKLTVDGDYGPATWEALKLSNPNALKP